VLRHVVFVKREILLRQIVYLIPRWIGNRRDDGNKLGPKLDGLIILRRLFSGRWGHRAFALRLRRRWGLRRRRRLAPGLRGSKAKRQNEKQKGKNQAQHRSGEPGLCLD